MACQNETWDVVNVSFDGTNFTPITGTVEVGLGGVVATNEVTDAAGNTFAGTEVRAGSVKFDIPNTNDFSSFLVVNRCGDLIVNSTSGRNYLFVGARLSDVVTIKSGDPKISLSFSASVGIEF